MGGGLKGTPRARLRALLFLLWEKSTPRKPSNSRFIEGSYQKAKAVRPDVIPKSTAQTSVTQAYSASEFGGISLVSFFARGFLRVKPPFRPIET